MSTEMQSYINPNVAKEKIDNLLENEEYLSEKGKIVVPLGATENGKVISCDLSSIPHILVCGFTGTGKTAFVQTLLAVLLSKHAPENVKIVIYDSKRIEYNLFSNTPHLYVPILQNEYEAISTLKSLAEESRRRFDLFARSACKDFNAYNNFQSDIKNKLPELFIVIDDFSSLSLNNGDMFELLNVLRNGRISGIHAIIVSSMASTKALQKELISNIPCHICFRLSSKTESRNILQEAGAEELFVPGEMIYKFQNEVFKCQSAFATYDNIRNVMFGISQSRTSVTSLGIEASMLFSDITKSQFEDSYLGYSQTEYDPMITEAAELVIKNQKTYLSFLQREMSIGFNQAMRIMDQLESLGVVEAQSSSNSRKVLMNVDDWNKMCSSVGLKTIKSANDTVLFQERLQHKLTNDTEPEPDEEEMIKLRDFAEFAIEETTISIHDNEIHFTKPIMTKLGKGTISPSFSGRMVTGLIYKKPSLFSSGYMTFKFDPNTKIKNEYPHLIDVNIDNVSDIIKIEFDQNQDRMIRLFLRQLSEDIGVSIKYL